MHSLLARLGAQCLNNFTAQKYFRNNKMQDKPEQHKQTQAEAGKKQRPHSTGLVKKGKYITKHDTT